MTTEAEFMDTPKKSEFFNHCGWDVEFYWNMINLHMIVGNII